MILIPYKRSYVFPAGQREFLNEHLETEDPEMFKIIEGEKKRQRESICLIPSEVSYTNHHHHHLIWNVETHL